MSFQQWAAAGFSAELTPVLRGDKKAFLPEWTTRPTLPGELAEWDRGRFNIGLRTAHFPVIDVDVDDDQVANAIEAVVKELAGPAPVRSRGNARRALLYRLDGPPFPKRVISFTLPNGEGAKVELLGDGQQLVVEGLHPEGKHYEWTSLPEAATLPVLDANTLDTLADAIRETVKAAGCTLPNGKAPKPATTPAAGEWVEFRLPPPTRHETWDDVEGLAREALDRLDPDMAHNEWLDVGMALHAKDPERGYSAWVSWSSRGKKFPGEEELRRRWASFEQGGGISFGTLLAMAGLSGRLAPAAPVSKAPTPARGARVELLPLLRPSGELLDKVFPPLAFAVEPYFPRDEVTELVGAHGIFKSTAALGACLSVVTGRPWGGAPVERGPAVFATMEDSARTLSRRIKAWLDSVPPGEERSDAEADIRHSFTYLAREHTGQLALTATEGRGPTGPRQHVVDHLAEILDGRVLAFLETASRLHGGPELNEALAVFAYALESVAVGSGAALGIVRHTSKEGARGGVVDSYAGRGGGALSDAARSVLVMARERRGADEEEVPDPFAPVRLVHAKSTHTAPGASILWAPVASEHGVYLRAVGVEEADRDAERRMLVFVRMAGADGYVRGAVRKGGGRPEGMTAPAALAALDRLVRKGVVTMTTEKRGKTKQQADVYRENQ